MRNDEPISISLSDVEAILINDAALQERSGFDYSLIWIPAVGLAVVGCFVWAIRWYLNRRKRILLSNDPANLFHELCTAHSLTWSQQRTVLKLAQLRKIANPGLVILDAGLWPEEDDPLINRNLANRLSEVHRILFEPVN